MEPPNNDTVGAGLSSNVGYIYIVVPILEVMPLVLQSVSGEQFVCFTEAVCFSDRSVHNQRFHCIIYYSTILLKANG